MPIDKRKHSIQSDHDRTALLDFLSALEDVRQGEDLGPSTEFYKLGRLAHRAAGRLLPVLHGLVSDGREASI